MRDDQVFRFILMAGFVALALVGVCHRAKAATNEKLDRRQEGLPLLISIRLLGGVGMGALIAYMIDPTSMEWSSIPLPVWMRWFGVGLGAITGMFLTWTFIILGKNITDTIVTRKEHQLVTTGPYRWVRHPFYVSFLLAVVANSLVTSNWFVLLVGVVVFVLLVIRTSKEEAQLVLRFGDLYRDYMRRTGRFFPKSLSL